MHPIASLRVISALSKNDLTDMHTENNGTVLFNLYSGSIEGRLNQQKNWIPARSMTE
jgi:hypothetical protein